MARTQGLENVCTKLQRIAEQAKHHRERVFTSLGHQIDLEFLREAYRRTRKSGAVGIDGVTATQYAMELDANLAKLREALMSGSYRAPAVRRVEIPKGKDSVRPIGIPSFEDKVLQRAVVMMLEPIYEADFLDCSHGFRPGRSPYTALDALWKGLMGMGGGWVVELDIKSYFDTIDHSQLRAMLDERVRDGVLRRVIHKWLKAGVMHGEQWKRMEAGTPQGGVISPLLSNVYLHHVLDVWFEQQVKPRLRGRAFMIRFADDAVLVTQYEDDAHRLLEVLPKRFAKYGLQLHPEKTRLIGFCKPPQRPKDNVQGGGPGSFDFLGFTHFWAKSRRGDWVVKRKTEKARFAKAVSSVRDWCAKHRHMPVPEQHQKLRVKMLGHYNYYGVTHNFRRIAAYYRSVRRAWQWALNRRGGKRRVTWERYKSIIERFPLPKPRIVHGPHLAAKP